MKMLYIVKTIVFLMSALLVAGVAFLFVKIAEKQSQSKLKNDVIAPVNISNETQAHLTATESIVSMTACGEFVCLLTQGNSNGERLLIVQPKTGQIQHILSLKNQEK